MVKRKTKNPMTKAERKRMSSLKREIVKERQKRNQAINKIGIFQQAQSKLIAQAKKRRK